MPSKLPDIDLTNAPGLDLGKTKSSKQGIVLFVAIILLVVTLLGSAVFAYFFVLNKTPQTATLTIDPQDSSTVKNVSWVAPEMPATFAARNENKDYSTNLVYQDDASGCKIIASIEPSPETSLRSDGEVYSIKDVDQIHEYEFESQTMSVEVDAPNSGVGKLTGVKVFKQFNYQLASLTYICKSDSWDAKNAELNALIQQFMVKTERVE